MLAWSFAALAQYAPPEEIRLAPKESPFVQRVLGARYSVSHHDTQVAVKTLFYSGHETESKLLEQAEARRLIAAASDERFEMPGTIGAAIERERGAPPLAESVQRLLARVEGSYEVSDVSSGPDGPMTRVAVLVKVRNRLPVAVHGVALRLGPEPPAAPVFILRCAFEEPRDLDAGAERLAPCMEADRTERIGPVLRALSEKSFPLRASYVATRDASFADGQVFVEEGREDGSREAFATLLAAPCGDKQNCKAVEKAEAQRIQVKQAEEAPSRRYALFVGCAFLFAALVAASVRARSARAGAMTVLALLVIVYVAIGAASYYVLILPRAGNEGFIFFFVAWYGGLPFVAAELALAASLASGRITRLRAGAAVVGLLVPAITAASFFQLAGR